MNKLINLQKLIEEIRLHTNDLGIISLDSEEFYNIIERVSVVENTMAQSPEREAKEKLFDRFWKVYPNKVNKKKAKDEWMKLKIEDCRKALEMAPVFANYRPFKEYNHPHPERYIKHRRFEDDVLKSVKKKMGIINVNIAGQEYETHVNEWRY